MASKDKKPLTPTSTLKEKKPLENLLTKTAGVSPERRKQVMQRLNKKIK